MAFDPLSFIIGQQTAKSGGGSGDYSDVHFVTFMSEDGTQELYKRAVVDGDDCADPVKRGYISEPTKESTAQYNYTLVGWSATPNGALDENILKSVTADKTVYANFAAVLRYYTVTYYDDDGTTVLKTESLAYGTMPSYVPAKVGYTFKGWTSEIEVVTQNANYTAVWVAKADLNAMTWAQIASYAESGEAASIFDIGATKTVTMRNGTVARAKIIGFNHDDLSDGSGKAGITFEFDTPADNQRISPTGTVSWMGSSASPYYNTSWDDCDTRKYWNNKTSANMMLSANLPKELRDVIKQVKKKYYDIPNGAIETTDDYLWAVSMSELGFVTNGNFFSVKEEGECYEGYTPNKINGINYPELAREANGEAVLYYTRSKWTSGTSVQSIGTTGMATTRSQGTSGNRMFPCFCV